MEFLIKTGEIRTYCSYKGRTKREECKNTAVQPYDSPMRIEKRFWRVSNKVEVPTGVEKNFLEFKFY